MKQSSAKSIYILYKLKYKLHINIILETIVWIGLVLVEQIILVNQIPDLGEIILEVCRLRSLASFQHPLSASLIM